MALRIDAMEMENVLADVRAQGVYAHDESPPDSMANSRCGTNVPQLEVDHPIKAAAYFAKEAL
jgi:hypothetical protein